AYFEVKNDPGKPFLVVANGTQARVLGTKFNVRAYAKDNTVTTTLVQGALRVQRGNQAKLIKPNEQAIVSGEGVHIQKDVDVNQAIAWKNGFINLDGENIQSIMQQISRWYDVD